MSIATIPRNVVDTWLRVTRLPLDAGARLFNDRQPTIGIAVDRLDATVRSYAGRLLRDESLHSDALRLRTAADERMRALELRREAEVRSEHADEKLSARMDRTRREREQAAHTAAQRLEAIDEQTSAAERRLDDEATRQKAAAKQAAAQRTKLAEGKSKRSRLDELDVEAAALEETETALVVEQEATRLLSAATAAKQARKG